MIGLAAFCLTLFASQREGFDGLLQELDAGRFRAAELALSTEDDPLRRAWGKVELSFRGRDFARAHALSTEALATFPKDPRLRLRAAGSALWLERTALAKREVESLADLVQGMTPTDREAWAPAVTNLREEVARMEERESSVAAVLRRARGTVAFVGALFAGAFLWLLRAVR